MCVDRAVLIAVLKGKTISSSAKARDYKAPIETRGRYSDGCSWKDTPAFDQVLPNSTSSKMKSIVTVEEKDQEGPVWAPQHQ